MTDPEQQPKRARRTRTRRGKGEGSLYQRPDGVWVGRIEAGVSTTGKRRRQVFYDKKKEVVAAKLTAAAAARLTGSSIDSGRMTVGVLLSKWLEESAKPSTSPGTAAEYERIVETYLVPGLGNVRLCQVKPLHIQSLLTGLERAKVGARTRQYCYATLHRAFVIAMRWQLMVRNPCDGIDPPRVVQREVKSLTVDQVQALLTAAELTRFNAMVVLAITTGMRQGELFGLHWESVDLERGVLQVRHSLEEIKGKLRLKEPKSKAGRRRIALAEMAIKALWKHRTTQLADGLGGCPLVFPNTKGGFMRKCSFHRQGWEPLRIASGLEGIHFHDLRHTCASMLLHDDVQPKAVQEILGHSNISMTMDTYAHLIGDVKRTAVATFDRAFGVKKPAKSG